MTAPGIIPTHTCFDDALDFFEQVLVPERLPDVADDFRIVHGICVGADRGEPYAHAWVEQLRARNYFVADPGDPMPVPTELVWQAGMVNGERVYFAIDRVAFYESYQVSRATRYTLQTASYLNVTTGHYGPWRRNYIDLVRKLGDGRIIGVVESAAPCVLIRVGEPTAWLRPSSRGRWA
jgi:hypothetical protein